MQAPADACMGERPRAFKSLFVSREACPAPGAPSGWKRLSRLDTESTLGGLKPAARSADDKERGAPMTIGDAGALAPGAAFLQKPFTRELLARKIREVLESPQL